MTYDLIQKHFLRTSRLDHTRPLYPSNIVWLLFLFRTGDCLVPCLPCIIVFLMLHSCISNAVDHTRSASKTHVDSGMTFLLRKEASM